MLLEGIIEELSPFRRALRGEDRNVFKSLMNKARGHASSCTVVPLLDPKDAMFLSISNDGNRYFGWFKTLTPQFCREYIQLQRFSQFHNLVWDLAQLPFFSKMDFIYF